MAEANKITAEELEAVRKAVTNFNRAKAALADLEYEKSKILAQAASLEQALNAEQKKLEDAYGSITINLEDGSYEVAEKNEMEVVK